MSEQPNPKSLASEIDSLRRLEQQSSIVSMQIEGEPIRRLWFDFKGRGWIPDENRGGDPQIGEAHRVEVLCPFDFPQVPPELRFETPLFHPAVSASGFASIESLGLTWQPSLGLEIVCERTWDVIRGAYLPVATPQNHRAHDWYAARTSMEVADGRRLRDLNAARARNVISYRRRAEPTVTQPTPPTPSSQASSEARHSALVAPPVVDPSTPHRTVVPVPQDGIRWNELTATEHRAQSPTQIESREEIHFIDHQPEPDSSLPRNESDDAIVFIERRASNES